MSGNRIMINAVLAKKINVSEGDNIILHFGTWNKEVEIGYSEDLEEKTVGISHSLFSSFTVPEDIDFEWYRKGNELFIGPVLGIIRGANFNKLTKGGLFYLAALGKRL